MDFLSKKVSISHAFFKTGFQKFVWIDCFMSWGDLMIFTCVVTTCHCFSKIGQNMSWTQYWECYLWQWGDGQGLSIHCSGATVSTEKRRNTEENGKSHYLQTVQWQNHLQVILWLMCHVEVRHSVFCIVRKCQSCASTWGERRNAFMSDSELQTTPLSGWLAFLRALSKAFPPAVSLLSASVPSPLYCVAMALPVASINVLSSLRTVSISYDVVPLRDPIFWILATNLEVLTLWSPRKLEFSKTLFKNHRLQVELEFKCFWSDQKSELYLKLSDKWGIVDKVTLKSRQSTAVRKKNRPR